MRSYRSSAPSRTEKRPPSAAEPEGPRTLPRSTKACAPGKPAPPPRRSPPCRSARPPGAARSPGSPPRPPPPRPKPPAPAAPSAESAPAPRGKPARPSPSAGCARRAAAPAQRRRCPPRRSSETPSARGARAPSPRRSCSAGRYEWERRESPPQHCEPIRSAGFSPHSDPGLQSGPLSHAHPHTPQNSSAANAEVPPASSQKDPRRSESD